MYPVIDWNQVWHEMLEENLTSKGCNRCSAFWNIESRAVDFLRASREEGADRIHAMMDVLDVTPESKILDIGAGPGSLALPLSKKVRTITAVEPSAPMVSLLRDEMKRLEVTNIRLIENHWEETTIQDLDPPYDQVIAAYSLGIPDLKGAILKMQEVCRGTITVFFAAGRPFWEEMMIYLWPHLHDAVYYPGPKVDVVWNLLYQMGIYADIRVIPLIQKIPYDRIEDAVDEYAPRMLIRKEWQRELLTQYIKNRLVPCDDHFILTGTILHTCISWKQKTEIFD